MKNDIPPPLTSTYENSTKSTEDNNAFKPYGHIVSLWHQGRIGSLEIDLDFTSASSVGDQSDVYGFTILPAYDFANSLLIPVTNCNLLCAITLPQAVKILA